MEVMKMLAMRMRRDKLSIGASGDDPFHLFSGKQCSLLPFLVFMPVETVSREQYPLSCACSLCFSVSRTPLSNNINTQHDQQEQQQSQSPLMEAVKMLTMKMTRESLKCLKMVRLAVQERGRGDRTK